ncbi:MAG: CotH kinase family protein [Lachnospiraceae bacterium]
MKRKWAAAAILLFLILSVGLINYVIKPQMIAEETKQKEAQLAAEKKQEDKRPHQKDIFSSHLPIITVETNGQDIQKESVIWGTMKVFDQNKALNYLDDEPQYSLPITIKYRGNSSYLAFDKKQYRVETYKKAHTEDKDQIQFLGMKSDSDWVLNAPFLDRTLLRNHLMYGVARETMTWAPDTRYCELFLNGKYQGLYLAIEPVGVSPNRIKLQTVSSITGETAYLVKRDREGSETNELDNFGTYAALTSQKLSISYPKSSKITKKQLDYIQNDISKFERVLYSDYFKDKEQGYKAYIDMDSFVTYYVLNEFFMNNDAGTLSTYMYKDLGGKLCMSVWDFNNALDNYAWHVTQTDGFFVNENCWFKPLFKDEEFTRQVVDKYRLLRETVLSDAYLIEEIDKTVELLGPAIDRNFTIWGYTFIEPLQSQDEHGNDVDPKSYAEALEHLKSTIIKRGKFMDENIEALYQYSR